MKREPCNVKRNASLYNLFDLPFSKLTLPLCINIRFLSISMLLMTNNENTYIKTMT